ncbi:MAG: NAD(P)-dependent oxidoreductase [Nitrososphaeria archaeon]
MDNILIVDEEFTNHDIEKQILADKLPGFDVIETNYAMDGLTKADLDDVVGVLAQIYASFDSITINKLPRLKGISVYGGGYDRVDVRYANSKNIKVSRVPDYCNDEVAEFVIMAILMFSKRIDELRKSFYDDAWGYKALEKKLQETMKRPVRLADLPKRVSGKTLFIVGYGKIGKSVAKKARGLGLKVIYYDNAQNGKDEFAESVAFLDGIRSADFISIHLPLSESTTGIFNYDTFKLMKRTSFIINTSRGRVVVENDLVRALREHLIAGAALDVFENEPLNTSNVLLKMENVIATPHCIYATDESIEILKKQATENLITMINGNDPEGLIRF